VISQSNVFDPSSKNRLTTRDLDRFAAGTLFDRVGRTICLAGCLPRKELFETWEVARRVRRRFRGGRILDVGGGHGLLAQVLLLLDDTSPEAVVLDATLPQSHLALHQALAAAWPRLKGRVTFRESGLEDVALLPSDLVVSVHGCGILTDRILASAIAARARVAVLPCCHDLDACDTGGLDGWIDGPLAVDVVRATRLVHAGYAVWTHMIPRAITPKNRLLLGAPGRPRMAHSPAQPPRP
jgi:hypothetical protein